MHKHCFLFLLLLLCLTGCTNKEPVPVDSPIKNPPVTLKDPPVSKPPVSQSGITPEQIPDQDPADTLNDILEELATLDGLLNGE